MTAAGGERGRRAYDGTRRREQAVQTREEILAVARRLFAVRGWAETTVRDIARAVRVSDPTVYNAYGGKIGLVVALVDTIDSATEVARTRAELAAADGDPAGQIAALVGYDRRLFENAGDILRIAREVGRTEAELAAAYQRGRARGEQVRQRVFGGWPRSVFADGVDVAYACDMSAGLCNVDAYDTLINERGWSPDQIEAWWRDALVRLVLA